MAASAVAQIAALSIGSVKEWWVAYLTVAPIVNTFIVIYFFGHLLTQAQRHFQLTLLSYGHASCSNFVYCKERWNACSKPGTAVVSNLKTS